MKYIKMLMVLMSFIFSAHAQHKISGTISDAKNGEVIPFASIYIPTLDKGSNADENGKFEIQKIPKGKYNLVISALGYNTVSMSISIEADTVKDIALTPSAIEISEVIVSTPFHKLQKENVMKVEREDLATLKNNGALTLADGMTNIAGVESVSTGVGIGKPVIRGLSANRVLVYTQGIRLENQQFGDEHGLGINDAGIESIEVIKGPASLLYGSDALGGVLYLNPEKFANAGETHADVNGDYYSNTDGYAINAGAQTSGEHFKFLVRGSRNSHADYQQGNGVNVTNSRFNETDLKTGIAYQENTFKSEIRYNYNRSNLGLPESIGVQNRERGLIEPYQEVDNHILSNKSAIFFPKSSLEFTLGFTQNDRREYEDHHHGEAEEEHDEDHEEEADHLEEEDHEDELPALRMKLKTFNYNVHYKLPVMGNFESILGVQGMLQKNKNYGEELLIPDANVNDIGVMATTHYHLNTSDFQFGIRFDNRQLDINETGEENGETYFPEFSKSFQSFNASAGFRTDLMKYLIGRVNLATGFRAPNLSELSSNGSHEGTNRYEIGNPDLSNEQNFQIDLSLEYGSDHYEFFANVYYNMIKDYIYLLPSGDLIDNDPVYNYVQNDSKLYGGEFGIHIHPHPLDWLHLESSFETVTGKLNSGEYLPLIPANKLKNTLRAEFVNPSKTFKSATVFVTLQSVFDQNNISEFETATDGYNLFNAGLNTQINAWGHEIGLKIAANNIFDTEYVSHLSRLKPDGIYNIGRNINVGLSMML
ncbi:TonB-dependent receptor [Robertkochia solimangrovi]|uniref:TonB-dependent receptor n=1 Tax=Robertkochia solimangrovi TaxID=2213046 RepID=UPI0011804ACD|nr:TonB-dependent receptor [Robertkochia solimangrovi]TRZ45328.1 TonB-dependent receptor [Robertkochia solimangrovi]